VLVLIGWFLFFALLKGTNMLVVAISVWLFGQIINYKDKFGYGDALKIAIHASTLPLLIFALMKLYNYEQLNHRLTIWTEIGTMLLSLFIVFMLKQAKTTGTAAKTSTAVGDEMTTTTGNTDLP
jgi:hypothetical protein